MYIDKNLLIIGPFPLPYTGLNIANDVVFEFMKNEFKHVGTIDMEINRGLDNSIGKWRWYKLKMIITYFHAYKILKADIVYFTIGQSFLGIIKYAPFIMLSSILNKRKVVHLHGNAIGNNFENFNRFKQIIARMCLKSFDRSIVLSRAMIKNFEPFMSLKSIHTVNNFVKLDFVLPANKLNSNYKILFLSNLLPAKGIYVFLDAVKILNKIKPDVEVMIAGSISSDYPDVLPTMKNLKNVTYYGTVSGMEKTKLYQDADVFCLPTLNEHEGQPLAILEAISNGCYIVASDVPGISDVIGGVNGELIKGIDKNNLSQAFIKAIKNQERLEVVKSNNRELSKDFTIDRFGHNILKVLTYEDAHK